MKDFWLLNWIVAGLMIAGMPSSTNYSLNSYGFGSGGSANSTSTNYGLNATAGEQAGSTSSANYKLGAGEKFLKQANVPTVTLVNGARWYNKLLVTVGPENNPSDALFAIAISSDGFVTTQYVKSDHTVGPSLGFADYGTYASWGGATGVSITGLQAETTYEVKVKAYRGNYTESGYGPSASAATSPPVLTFDIDVAATDTATNPPYQVSMGDLLAATVIDSPVKVWTTLDTNGESGGIVYITGENNGLRSSAANYTIASGNVDLSAALEGFGAQITSATQSSGGPLVGAAQYATGGQNVGAPDTQIRNLFTSSSPIISGRGSFMLKAKSQALTPASTDYTEILTVIASASF